MRRYAGTEVLAVADELGEAYMEVFSAPPWSKEDPGLRQFRERLDADAVRPGFRAAVATSGSSVDDVDGFATGWTTPARWRTDRAYPKVAAQLGPERLADLLIGALEVDELAVRARARRQGLGRRLLDALLHDAPRAWLLTARQATDTVAFYERGGWHEVPPLPGTTNDVVVFLAPSHPGAALPGR
jgi:ribosomal protein S18 acetylase RimI-like enzyme